MYGVLGFEFGSGFLVSWVGSGVGSGVGFVLRFLSFLVRTNFLLLGGAVRMNMLDVMDRWMLECYPMVQAICD